MGTNTSPPTQQPPPYWPDQPPPRKRHRVFLWVFLAIQVTFLIWIISAGVSAPQSGWSPGVGLQVGLWAVTDVITGAIDLICQLPRVPR